MTYTALLRSDTKTRRNLKISAGFGASAYFRTRCPEIYIPLIQLKLLLLLFGILFSVKRYLLSHINHYLIELITGVPVCDSTALRVLPVESPPS
jgi:hypothetical protein